MKKDEVLSKLVIQLKEEKKQEKECIAFVNDEECALHVRLGKCAEAFQHSLTVDSMERAIVRRVLVLYR